MLECGKLSSGLEQTSTAEALTSRNKRVAKKSYIASQRKCFLLSLFHMRLRAVSPSGDVGFAFLRSPWP